MSIRDEDLRFDITATGMGSLAACHVRVTHTPTGLSATVDGSRIGRLRARGQARAEVVALVEAQAIHARIIASFRETYTGMSWFDEAHLAACPSTRVVKYEIVDEADFQFTSIITCDHSRPMGYSRGAKEEDGDE